MLSFPSFDVDFTLETDVSIQGLGAILSQPQTDGKLHPVAYTSRALNKAEKNYSITELETLAVVWAISHFHSYLYGNTVTVLTDHSAVRAILETPNPTGKHARWWTKGLWSRCQGGGYQVLGWTGECRCRCPFSEPMRSPTTVWYWSG